MFKTFINAFKVKDVRERILFTIGVLLLIRIGCQIPLPGIDRTVVKQIMDSLSANGLGVFNMLTGSSFSAMSIFALNVTTYITASIVVQLLTMAIPKLERLQKDEGQEGREKITRITRYVTIGLSLVESVGVVIGFGNQGMFGTMTVQARVIYTIADIIILTAGAMVVMWLGEKITERGIGNGISMILLINIVSTMPNDFISLYQQFIVGGRNLGMKILAGVLIVALFIGIIVFIVYLNNGRRNIPVQYSQKVSGRKMMGGQQSLIPLQVNTAGVIPVIFASSLLQFPVLIASIIAGGNPPEWTRYFSSNNWFHIHDIKYTIGFVLYLALVILFAYYYTDLTFNTKDIASNLQKQGGVVPGIRPGSPTEQYLHGILKYMIFIGAVALCIIVTVPMVVSGVFLTSLSFAGTSLIIVVSVIIETAQALDSMMVGRNYSGFLQK